MSNLNQANKDMLAYIGIKPGTIQRDSDSWYTPRYLTDTVRDVLGGIDLDPFSSTKANEYVKAERFFDITSNAFEQKWFESKGTVFMNPPYGRKLIYPSVRIFIKHWQEGFVSQGIVLVNNATETIWFQLLLENASSICLVKKRIAFATVDGKKVSGNTRGQVFLYFGNNAKKFKTAFKEIGCVLTP